MRLPLPYRYLAVSAVLLAFVGFNWFSFFQDLSRVGTQEDGAAPAAGSSADNAEDSGILAALRRSAPPRTRIIAEQNIFSPLRREYVPPESDQATAQGEDAAEGFGPAGLPRDDVELRGIVVIGGQRKAILRFLAMKPEVVMALAEGESTDRDGGPQGPVFTVARIDDEYARIRDGDGKLYQIGLFDHGRIAPPAKAPGVQITITPLPPAPQASPVIAPDSGKKNAGPATPGSRPAARKIEAKG